FPAISLSAFQKASSKARLLLRPPITTDFLRSGELGGCLAIRHALSLALARCNFRLAARRSLVDFPMATCAGLRAALWAAGDLATGRLAGLPPGLPSQSTGLTRANDPVARRRGRAPRSGPDRSLTASVGAGDGGRPGPRRISLPPPCRSASASCSSVS